jgi:soluble lytic murein transglycosylase-like protein
MQLMPGTAKHLKVADRFDPSQNVDGGVRYLKFLLDTFKGDVSLALAAYNAGLSKVAKYGGIPPYEETRTYVSRVLSYMR